MRLYMPVIMTLVFLGYVGYLIFIKKEFRKNLMTSVFPGLFFIAVWAALYFLLLR